MLVSRTQLDFVRRLVAEFEAASSTMKPLELYQSYYIAIVAMLRSIGHVFEKVDCDTPDRKKWAKERWLIWKREPIFADFIDFNRNQLLKEFRGGLQLDSPAISSPAFVVNPSKPGMIDQVVAFDASRATVGGTAILPLLRAALAFWDKTLLEAESAWEGDQ